MYQKIISEGSPSGRRPIWQHAVSIMGNHLLPNNKDTTKMTMMIIVMDFSYWKCTHRPFNLPFSKSNNQYFISGNHIQTDDDYQSRSSHQQAPCSDPVRGHHAPVILFGSSSPSVFASLYNKVLFYCPQPASIFYIFYCCPIVAKKVKPAQTLLLKKKGWASGFFWAFYLCLFCCKIQILKPQELHKMFCWMGILRVLHIRLAYLGISPWYFYENMIQFQLKTFGLVVLHFLTFLWKGDSILN